MLETLLYVHHHVLPAALSMLPGKLDTSSARAMLLAIALQESDKLRARSQYHGGPAHGFWQFERGGGVRGVLANAGTRAMLAPVLHTLVYPDDVDACYAAITHSDVLACCFARLLLWTVPGALPRMDEADRGWSQYVAGWRPGKPHPATWQENFDEAWRVVIHE